MILLELLAAGCMRERANILCAAKCLGAPLTWEAHPHKLVCILLSWIKPCFVTLSTQGCPGWLPDVPIGHIAQNGHEEQMQRDAACQDGAVLSQLRAKAAVIESKWLVNSITLLRRSLVRSCLLSCRKGRGYQTFHSCAGALQ